MGIEYKLQFAAPDADSVSALMSRLPSARESLTKTHWFELATKAFDRDMPDAFVRVEPDGAYFCDKGGAGKEFLGILVARLASELGTVTATEL